MGGGAGNMCAVLETPATDGGAARTAAAIHCQVHPDLRQESRGGAPIRKCGIMASCSGAKKWHARLKLGFGHVGSKVGSRAPLVCCRGAASEARFCSLCLSAAKLEIVDGSWPEASGPFPAGRDAPVPRRSGAQATQALS